ncbi:MAG: purine-nucleoside phosphorylase [Proteobacteria bacterium]|nr:MAG: purine-nucleoside phosphorylase [Pseudomonadota bacterium]
MSIPTPHIEVKELGVIADTVLMPGDPLRAKFIADTFLTDVVQFNSVRNMFGYTGYYKGKKVSVMGSGMGMASIGIYSYELFAFYGVENIIRIGTAGSYDENTHVYDVILAEDAWSESTYAKVQNGYTGDVIRANDELNKSILAASERTGIEVKVRRVHSSSVFYRQNFDEYKQTRDKHNCVCVEMESFALFHNANVLNKRAACVLTISDSLVSHVATSSEERQTAFTKMMELVLESI